MVWVTTAVSRTSPYDSAITVAKQALLSRHYYCRTAISAAHLRALIRWHRTRLLNFGCYNAVGDSTVGLNTNRYDFFIGDRTVLSQVRKKVTNSGLLETKRSTASVMATVSILGHTVHLLT